MTTLIAAALIPYTLALAFVPALRSGKPTRADELRSALFFVLLASLGWAALVVLVRTGAEPLLAGAVALATAAYTTATAACARGAARSTTSSGGGQVVATPSAATAAPRSFRRRPM